MSQTNFGSGPIPVFGYASAVPTDASQAYQAGTILFNNAPAVGQPLGWLCLLDGKPGTWVALSALGGLTPTTLTAAAAIPSGVGNLFINGASGGTYTLAAALAQASGFHMRIKNIAANSVTLVPATGEAYVDAAAITLAQNGVVLLGTNGKTKWVKGAV